MGPNTNLINFYKYFSWINSQNIFSIIVKFLIIYYLTCVDKMSINIYQGYISSTHEERSHRTSTRIPLNPTLQQQVLFDSIQKLPCVPTHRKFTNREVHRHIATILRPGNPGLMLSNMRCSAYVRESGTEIFPPFQIISHYKNFGE